MLFLLKKLIAALLQPLSISLILSFIGLLCLWIGKAQRTAKVLITLGFVFLLLFSFNFLSLEMLKKLEGQYPPLIQAPNNVNTIVVLGGGIGGNIHYPANTRINSASLSRLVEGIRLYRQLQHNGVKPTLILSGGRIYRSRSSEAEKMKNTAIILGVELPQLVMENGSLDTYQEALYLKPQLKNKPFILVTSAAHMPRAMELFRKQGMRPIPAPTQFLAIRNLDPTKDYLPNSNALVYSDIALHEYIGLIWAWIRKES